MTKRAIKRKSKRQPKPAWATIGEIDRLFERIERVAGMKRLAGNNATLMVSYDTLKKLTDLAESGAAFRKGM